MDEALLEYLKSQSKTIELLNIKLEETNKKLSENVATRNVENPVNVPWPAPLNVDTGDVRENLEIFENNWKDYCNATGTNLWDKSKDLQKTSLMLSAIGTTAKTRYMDFGLTDEDKESEEKAIIKIRDCVVAKSNVIYDRYMFNTCCQNVDESFDFYLIRLKKLVKLCNYGNDGISNELLRDRIVVGIKETLLKKKLMEIPDLTLNKAIDVCKIAEVTQNRLSNMKNDEANVTNPVNKITNKSAERAKRKCKFCAAWHVFEKGTCPALGKTCSICKKKNHLEVACFKNNNSTNKRKTNRVNEICNNNPKDNEEVSSEDDNDNPKNVLIAKIEEKSTASSKFNVIATLKLKFGNVWKQVECMLDTGSNSCLVGYSMYKALMGQKNPVVSKSKYELIDFNGNTIRSIGEVKIPCEINNQRYTLLFQVVNRNHGLLLSSNACSALKLVKYSDEVKSYPRNLEYSNLQIIETVRKTDASPEFDKIDAERIIEKYNDVFRDSYGLLPGEVELEIDRDIKPVIQRARRIPVIYRDKLKVELKKLVQDGIIEKITKHTDWVSNVLIVKKPNSFRICLDPIPLNKALKRPNYQFTTVDEILPELGKAQVFSTCDAARGFWQVKLTESSSELTCFWTPFGRYVWKRLPFGICSAPEIFQMKMYEMTHDLKGVEVLADDLLIYGSGDNKEEALIDHNKNLESLMIRLRQYNCKLNRSKLKLCQSSVKFFGHILSSEGLKADTSKISAIQNMKSPENKNELQRFMGMVNYLARYIKDLSTHCTPLRKLLLEDTPWIWKKTQEDEFKKLKLLVGNVKTLKFFDSTKPITIECDSSSSGLGAALFQQNNIVAYASRTLTATERNYAQIEKELLAIVFACIRFDQMIVGHICTVKTDHKPLINIFQKPLLKAPKRLQLMLMILQRYSLKLEFIKGKNNIVADTLSRMPVGEDNDNDNDIIPREKKFIHLIENVNPVQGLNITDERIENIRQVTQKDISLQKLIQLITYGWPNNIRNVPDEVQLYYKFKEDLSTQNGLIFMENRILIPCELRKLIRTNVHVSHNGVESTLRLARENVFWPGMSSEIREMVKKCDICAKYASSLAKPPMLSHDIAAYPFQFISMDVFFTHYKGKQNKFLVTVCHYSDYIELDILNDMTSNSVVNACKRHFSRYGIPQRVLTDNGTNFVSKEFAYFASQWKFTHVVSSPHYHQSNGKGESAVKIAKRLIQKSEESGEDIWYSLLHWRNIPNKTNSSPAQRMLSRRTRTGIPSITSNFKPEIIKNVPDKLEENRRRAKYYYDQKTKSLPPLTIGQPVFVQLNPDSNKLWTKGTIENKITDRSYAVNVDDSSYRRDLIHIKPRLSDDVITPKTTADIYDEETSSISDIDNDNVVRQNVTPQIPVSSHTYDAILSTATEMTSNSTQQPTRPRRISRMPEKYKDYCIEG